jgi:tripartite-type tricarboxylate transporter receptor subunit TctC
MQKKWIAGLLRGIVPILVLTTLPLLIAFAQPAEAAETFPSKAIKFVICGSAGDAFDSIGRSISPTLAKKLGVSVLPVDIKGPMNVDFLNTMHDAAPDGYTLGFIGGWEWLYYLVKPGGPLRFEISTLPLVTAMTTYPDCVFLSSKSKLGIKTAQELLTCKVPIRIADYSGLTPGAVALKIVSKDKGFDLRPVVLDSFAEANLATIRGDVDILTATPSGTLLKYVRSGDYSPLFIWGKERFVNLPNVPCSRELGISPELEGVMLRRLFPTATGVPKDRIDRLGEGIKATLADPGVMEWAKKSEQPLTFETAEECTQRMNGLGEFYRKRSEDFKEFLK